jgi:hypothetical protein
VKKLPIALIITNVWWSVLFFVIGFCAVTHWKTTNPTTEQAIWDANTMPLPTIRQVQQAVGAEPDGIIGPETIRLWDLAICQQYADRWNYYYRY